MDLLRVTNLGLVQPDEFCNMMKKNGWELTEPEENEEVWEGFYYDDQNRLRYIPETPEQRTAYSRRVRFAKVHAEKFPRERREEVEKRLRMYTAEDLKDAKIHADTDEEIIRVRGRLEGGYYNHRDKSVHVRGRDPYDLDHEIAHYLTDKKFGTTSPAKYSKFLEGNYRNAISIFMGDYAVKNEAEVIAEAFSFMKIYPAWTRRIMRVSPEIRDLLNNIMHDLGYGISGVRKRR